MEDDEAVRSDRIPACVRRKLREVGVRLTAEQWRALPSAARRRLSAMRVEEGMERHAFAVVLSWLVRTFSDDPRIRNVRGSGQERGVASERAFPWRRSEAPPAIASALTAGGVTWSDLSSDVRFALVDAAQTGAVLGDAVTSPEGCRECPPKSEP